MNCILKYLILHCYVKNYHQFPGPVLSHERTRVWDAIGLSMADSPFHLAVEIYRNTCIGNQKGRVPSFTLRGGRKATSWSYCWSREVRQQEPRVDQAIVFAIRRHCWDGSKELKLLHLELMKTMRCCCVLWLTLIQSFKLCITGNQGNFQMCTH